MSASSSFRSRPGPNRAVEHHLRDDFDDASPLHLAGISLLEQVLPDEDSLTELATCDPRIANAIGAAMSLRRNQPQADRRGAPRDRDESDARLAEVACIHQLDPAALVLSLGRPRTVAALRRLVGSTPTLATYAGRLLDNIARSDRDGAIDVEATCVELVRSPRPKA